VLGVIAILFPPFAVWYTPRLSPPPCSQRSMSFR
jgi:hypothetical protein